MISHRLRMVSAWVALIVATFLVVTAMLTVTLNLRQLKDSFGGVKHTDDVLLQVAEVEANLVAAESAERGFLLTSNNEYRSNFEQYRVVLGSQLDTLGKLVGDNSEQVKKLRDLRQTAEARLQQLKEIIELGSENLNAAIAALRAVASQRLTDVVREKLDGFREVEVNLRRQREAKATRDMTRTISFAIASTVLALLSGSVGLIMLQRERDRFRERELQLELAHLSRLNMMGETAGMLAHELNQPLTATSNYLSAAQAVIEASDAPPLARITDLLSRANVQMQRAGDILRRLRSFVQKSEPTITKENVSTLFDEAIGLLGMRMEGLSVTTHTAPDIPSVIVDRVEVQQVLVNLMRNAVEAMGAGARRELRLSAVCTDGQNVQMNVADTGPGLAKEVGEKLFQPFITTKTDGMGIGLSICRNIIARNGGRIWTEPNPAGGTIFSFTVPRASAPVG